ncbi:MAG: phosphatase PAP2 family protein [Phycisphaerales bacterium]|nr:phosphatase PAP2 family protein [Phycisphaerales bacterium]
MVGSATPHLSGKGGWRWSPLVMLLVGLGAFTLVATDVVFQGPLARWDRPLQAAIYHFARPAEPSGWPPGVWIGAAISGLGNLSCIAVVALVVASLLAVRRRWATLVVWGIALIGSGIINPVLKSAFRVPRPREHTFYTFPLNSGWSFPSGHTMAATITAGTLALILLHHIPHTRLIRTLAWSAVAILSLLEGMALMYVGVHYLTDVLGALAISFAWLGVIRFLLPPRAA